MVASYSTQLAPAANVLLAVHNPFVAAMLQATLMSRGMVFVKAPSQETALQLLRANARGIDLVITSPRYKDLMRFAMDDTTDARLLYICASNPEPALPENMQASILAMPFSPARFIEEVNRLLFANERLRQLAG